VWRVSRAAAKSERKIKELLETLEALKDASARKLEAKDQDISDLRCNIMTMLQKVRPTAMRSWFRYDCNRGGAKYTTLNLGASAALELG
jgi:selenocysteine-specific translation elongation factor